MALGGAKGKTEGKSRSQLEPGVKDLTSALSFLTHGDLKSEDDEMSFELLSAIAMQLSQQNKSLAWVQKQQLRGLMGCGYCYEQYGWEELGGKC